jgi:hypothetical protein
MYQGMASMPGPMPPKKDDNTEELMKGFHGIFKAMSKMSAMNPALDKDFAAAKAAMKNAFANVLKGDPATLDGDDKKDVPPPSNDATPPPPEPPATPAGDGAPVPA